jgi:glycosyltransferase involved in cell wall biosynthesis
MMARLPTRAHASRGLAAALPVPLRHVWQPDEGFRAAMARNRGTLAARGDYIVFLDGDCIPQHDFIARHRALSEPGCLVSGSRILLSESLTRRVLRTKIAIPAIAPCRHLGAGATRLAGACAATSTRCCSWACAGPTWGACANFRGAASKAAILASGAADLERVNGFDESFTGWGHEDSDLVVRLFHAGVKRKDGAVCHRGVPPVAPGGERDQESSNRRWCWNGRRAR